MNKIKLSALTTLLLASASMANEMIGLEQITVATKSSKSIDGVAATVEVITQKEIQKMGAENLKDIIDRASGLNITYGTFPNASAKSKSSITIRGMSANGTLILLDGRRLAGEVQNPYDLERIPASVVERVEIVKGPMSSLYGADAVGGVINIITKKPSDEMKIDAGARYGANKNGDADNLNLNLSIQDRVDKLSYSAYATMTTTKPYTQRESENVWVPAGGGKVKPSLHPNPSVSANIKDSYSQDVTFREDSEVYTLGGRVSYDFSSELSVGFDVNYFKEERDGAYIGYFHPSAYMAGPNKIPVFNVPVNSKDENNRLDISMDVTYSPFEDLVLKARAYNSNYEKRNTTTARAWSDMGYTSESASAQNGMNADVDLSVAELSALYMLNEEHAITVGGEYREEKRDSSVFSQANTMTRKEMDYKSLYLQDEWQVDEKLSAILGARYDDISNADSKATFRVGAIYEFDKLASLRANFAQGYRVPDIREMYIHKQTPSGLNVGASAMGYDLKPESTNSYEIGLGGHNDTLRYDLVFFYNDVKDMIAQTMGIYGGNAAYTFENVANANTKGMELSLKYLITKELSSHFYWSELRTENEVTKKDLEFQPERTFMLGFDYKFTNALSGGIFAKYIGEQHYTDIINRGAPTEIKAETKADGFTTVDLRADYKLSKMFEIYGGVNNIADEKVDDVLGSNVGTYYFAGVRAHF
ncbi:MAG TPA: TonB-dependent receptor [Sulfurimonas sp.]|uniref:TonB-dependent receptor plug domain-containing protein n=1 Tax=Sulfurimonas sp. TaxID=2022749 RepID=UPI002CCC678D|nr:TonB-dependent receptor [Sulfurimonas sp.]HUH42646.1 TonB-dependent receptor [Sulfurimonas sp.]